MSIKIVSNEGEVAGLKITADHEAAVALNQDVDKAGFAAIASEKGVYPDGTRLMRELEASDDYRLRVEDDNFRMADYPLGAAVNTRRMKTILTTQTITVAGGRYELNASGITTVSTGSMLQTWQALPFYKAHATYAEFNLEWSAAPLPNWSGEWGFGNPATAIAAATDGAFFRILDGAFYGVVRNASAESTVNLGELPAFANAHDFIVEVTMGAVHFWHEGALLGTVTVPAGQFGPFALSSLPLFVRTFNGAVAPSSAIKMHASAIGVTVGGSDMNRDWATAQAVMGGHSANAPTGATVGQTANYANSAAPASATLSNTAAGYTTLGGQFQFAAVAGAETDYALFGYHVPSGSTLVIKSIAIDTVNTGAAVATTATLLQWAVAVGSSAVSLATADGAATKSPARIPIGLQTFPIGAAIGAMAQRLTLDVGPLPVNPGEFVHILLKMPLGTATASQVIRGVVSVNGFFE